MGFDTTDLLRQGEYSDGDILQLGIIGGYAISASTTSTTFTTRATLFTVLVKLDNIVPPDLQAQAAVVTQIDSDSNETGTLQIYNNAQNIVVAEVAATGSFTRLSSGYSAYSPTDTSQTDIYKARLKTTDSTDGSTFVSPTLHIGVKL